MPLQAPDLVFLVADVPFEHVSAAALALASAIMWYAKNDRADRAFEREENRRQREETKVAWETVREATAQGRAYLETGNSLLKRLDDSDVKMERILVAIIKLADNNEEDRKLGRDLVSGVLDDMKGLKDDHSRIIMGIERLERTGTDGP